MQLQELKKAYDTCRISKENYKHLLQQREELQKKIIEHKEKTKAELYNKKIKESRVLDRLKTQLHSIDHQIDELGEHHDEKLAMCKAQLIAAIQKAFPESIEAYEEFCQKHTRYQDEEEKCIRLRERLHAFYAAMEEGAASKRSRGFYKVLFGRNAKVILAHAIRKASIEAERCYTQINDEQIQHFLNVFLEEANRPWNGKLYRERFDSLYQEFTQLMEQLVERQRESRLRVCEAENSIEAWIEQYSAKITNLSNPEPS